MAAQLAGWKRKMDNNLKLIKTVGGVHIYAAEDHSYVRFVSDLDVCNDGSGGKHGDKHFQPRTAYYNKGKFLNADVDAYMVIPISLRKMLQKKVMGCRAQVSNIESGQPVEAVCGETGPDNKTGEAAYCLAKQLNPKVTHNSGDKRRIYLYELWPGTPATVGGKRYQLE